MKTMLKCAKGSPLDITSTLLDRVNVLTLLSPHAQQFRTINFVRSSWPGVREFSKAAFEPLLLLNTLKVDVVWSIIRDPETMNPPLLPLFSGAVNLRNFVLRSEGVPLLSHFAFQNFTTSGLRVTPKEFPVSQLLGSHRLYTRNMSNTVYHG